MDLLEALKLIKDECEKHIDCRTCPMRDVVENECTLENVQPCVWTFKEHEVAPRLFA